MKTITNTFTLTELNREIRSIRSLRRSVIDKNDAVGIADLWLTWYEFVYGYSNAAFSIATTSLGLFWTSLKNEIDNLILELEEYEDEMQNGSYEEIQVKFNISTLLKHDIPSGSQLTGVYKNNKWIYLN